MKFEQGPSPRRHGSSGEEIVREMDDLGPPTKASEWLIALLDRPDDRQLHAHFRDWMDTDPAHGRDWREIAATYQAMGLTLPEFHTYWPDDARGARPLPDLGSENEARPARARGYARLLGGLAGLAMAASIALFALPTLLLEIRADYVTGTAESRTIQLEDGSVVHLSPESALAVDFTAGERRVRLVQGEAFFEVKPDATRPFRVATERADATVLGTAFDVHIRDALTEIAVREGRVQIAFGAGNRSQAEILSAGDWARIAADGHAERGKMPVTNVASWIGGELVVRDQSVSEVVADLRHYYAGAVILRGDTLAASQLTGIYRLSEPVSALRAIAVTQGASFHQISPWIILISGE